MNIPIRILDGKDAELFHELRLRGLMAMPEAFGSSYEEEADLGLDEISRRLDARPNAVFGAFAGGELAGIAGFAAGLKTKQKHKGLLWGVYVDEQWRGRQLGKRLTQAVIEHARAHVDILLATVMAENLSARTLYLSLGFTVFGVEKDALRINGKSYTDELLRLELV
jgi:ribosomal protein S18 acetylase RimI-like enzyme